MEIVYARRKSSPPSLFGASIHALMIDKGIDIRTSYKQILLDGIIAIVFGLFFRILLLYIEK
jgi:hypothetical protein